jgi:3-oxoacyl-[acyl-carrier-protein] synthase II
MNIAGIGVVGTMGRGVASLEAALNRGWTAPGLVDIRGSAGDRLPVYAVPPDVLSDKTVLAKARRADRFTRMSVLAAWDALQDSGMAASVDRTRLGVIVATALGPHATTFGFLDGILDFGDAAVSPTAFSHSVHNAAASYIAMTLDVRGPTLTLTHFDFAFHEAVSLARTWLAANRCDAVLVGAVDELGTVMQVVCGRLLRPAADGRIKPFDFSRKPESVPGEGSVFLMLTRDNAGAAYGRMGAVSRDQGPVGATGQSVQLLDTCGLAKDETAYHAAVMPGTLTAGYAPLFGGVMTGTAFHAAIAALMLKRQSRYAVPVTDNPHGLALCLETGPAEVDQVFCTRLDCGGRRGTLHLSPVR